MEKRIIEELENIEKDYDVKIILAIESGSRAWGFPSRDSDYDVRFIYVHKKDWYLSVAERKDVIELPNDSVIDINGWDLRKSLQLMRKSNSSLLEWMTSPIRYRVWRSAFERMYELSKIAFMPETSCRHYLSMAKSNIAKFQINERVKLKVYMYAVRPILCCEWIIKTRTQPPMHIADLLDEVADDKPFKDKMTDFINIKRKHSEKYAVERSEIIESYINREIVDLQRQIPENPQKPSWDRFDDVFRSILRESIT